MPTTISAALVPTASGVDRFSVVAVRDGADNDGVFREEVPGVAALRHDVLAGFDHGMGAAVGA